LQRSAALLECITGMHLVVRLGLLSSDGQQLVMLHLAANSTAAEEGAAAQGGDVPIPDV
jgi:hypothetical protein